MKRGLPANSVERTNWPWRSISSNRGARLPSKGPSSGLWPHHSRPPTTTAITIAGQRKRPSDARPGARDGSRCPLSVEEGAELGERSLDMDFLLTPVLRFTIESLLSCTFHGKG